MNTFSVSGPVSRGVRTTAPARPTTTAASSTITTQPMATRLATGSSSTERIAMKRARMCGWPG